MMLEISPLVLTFIISGAVFALGYWRGYDKGLRFLDAEDIIGATITKLCQDGYIHNYKKDDGELEILTIEEYRNREIKLHNENHKNVNSI